MRLGNRAREPEIMGSNPGTLAEAAKNFLVGAAAPLRGRRFLNFFYGGVEGGPSVILYTDI